MSHRESVLEATAELSADAVSFAVDGEAHSVDDLWVECYEQLRQLARSRLRTNRGLTQLDTTGLVGDVYARMAPKHQLHFKSHGHFLSYCSQVMRSVIVDLVREMKSQKNGGEFQPITLNTEIDESVASDADPVRIDEALEDLAKMEPRLARVVEMRYFGGYTEDQVAEALEITTRTVQRDWQKARIILKMMLDPNT